ncbi:MAG: protein kinase, partial [Myxococcota bacterium]
MSDQEPRAGDRFGRYELVAPLGRGGMGQVWEAVLHGPRGFRKAVALKLARTRVADPSRREALIAEARLGARLQHVNLVSTLELGEHDGRWFVAMERVHGVATSTLVARGPLPPEAVVEIGVQACAGLGHLHALEPTGADASPPMRSSAPPSASDDTASGSLAATWMPEDAGEAAHGGRAGWVHRDIKPSNLLVDETGVVKVADLGVARLAGEVGRAAGTAGYMPPEQQTGREDARADLFALGATLLELATGTPPFGRGPSAMQAVHDLRREPLVEAAETVLPGFGAIIRRCLEPDPDQRPASAEALAMALAALVPGPARATALLRVVGSDLAMPADTLPLPGRLPPAHDRFVGREHDRDRVQAHLASGERLVTLVGLGGVGKTRLAREVADEQRGRWPGGVWWFDLTDATAPADLVATLARGLAVRLVDGDPDEQLVNSLRAQGRALLVLDDLDGLPPSVSTQLTGWLDHTAASLVVTRRAALQVRGERVVRVGPLDPDAAAALFVARSPREIDASDPVAELVDALDGLPLAIGLAAARTRMLSVSQIRARLDEGLQLLSGGSPDAPVRHVSLEACFTDSYEGLSLVARHALGQLTTFVGGFTLEAAEHTLDLGVGAPWPVDVVQELVDAQMLEFDAPTRFRMLGMVRPFVEARTDPALVALAERRHGTWFANAGTRTAIEALRAPGGAARLAELVAEMGNLTAARQRALARGDVEVAAACACAAWEVAQLRGPFGEAADGLEAVLAASADA